MNLQIIIGEIIKSNFNNKYYKVTYILGNRQLRDNHLYRCIGLHDKQVDHISSLYMEKLSPKEQESVKLLYEN